MSPTPQHSQEGPALLTFWGTGLNGAFSLDSSRMGNSQEHLYGTGRHLAISSWYLHWLRQVTNPEIPLQPPGVHLRDLGMNLSACHPTPIRTTWTWGLSER